MRGVKRTVPLYITCQRPGCEAVKQVRTPSQQRRYRFCSPRCIGLVCQNIRHGTAKGVARSARARKARVLARVQGLVPLEAFRLGYQMGLESKLRQIRKRYQLVRKAATP